MTIQIDVVSVNNRRGSELVLRKFYLPDEQPDQVILITPAMGIKQYFYSKLAEYLADHGYLVFTMDYSGIELSNHKSIKEYDIDIISWKEDIEDVTDWLDEKFNLDMIYMCHSVGGQLFGLMQNNIKFKGFISVSTQNGYWRNYQSKKYLYFLFWYIFVPSLTKLLGYFPAKRINFGENLPKNVMIQWKKWCTSENYFFSDEDVDNTENFKQFTNPILAWSFSDDPYASKESIDFFIEKYVNSSNKLHNRVEPKDIDLKSIGHVGFFKEKSQELWDQTITWIRNLQ